MEVTDSSSQESSSLTFEWTINEVRKLFDSTAGEAKSKVIKSVKFGGGRWQILFYANAGTEGGFVSLYLSCEPTLEEKENAPDGRWTRDGVYKFSFEIKNASKTILYNTKEAQSHSFTYQTANWGWAQFTKRDTVLRHYQSSIGGRFLQDSLVIICTIHTLPTPPQPPPTVSRKTVPMELLDAIGSMLDDPSCTDVEFVLPARRVRKRRTILATKKLLSRAEYFRTMFSSGFAESNNSQHMAIDTVSSSQDTETATGTQSQASNTTSTHSRRPSRAESQMDLSDGAASFDYGLDDSDLEDEMFTAHSESEDSPMAAAGVSAAAESDMETPTVEGPPSAPAQVQETDEADRDVRTFDSAPTSPEQVSNGDLVHVPLVASSAGPPKLSIPVHDIAYTTYFAMLFYIYTDTIVFAPLTSALASQPAIEPAHDRQASFGPQASPVPATMTRREWIARWVAMHPGRPTPCSAKAVYRLADKLDLSDLRERASRHIIKSLTPANIAHEVFSPFSAMFADIRKVQVSIFLEHWKEIRSSDTMLGVWKQIRSGKHPGFEEVWPKIAEHLVFMPPSETSAAADASAGDAPEP